MAHDHTTNGTGQMAQDKLRRTTLQIAHIAIRSSLVQTCHTKLCNTHRVQTTVHCKLCHLHFVLVFYIKHGNTCTLNTDLSHFCNFLALFVHFCPCTIAPLVEDCHSTRLEQTSRGQLAILANAILHNWTNSSKCISVDPIILCISILDFCWQFWVFKVLYVGCFSKRKTKAC